MARRRDRIAMTESRFRYPLEAAYARAVVQKRDCAARCAAARAAELAAENEFRRYGAARVTASVFLALGSASLTRLSADAWASTERLTAFARRVARFERHRARCREVFYRRRARLDDIERLEAGGAPGLFPRDFEVRF